MSGVNPGGIQNVNLDRSKGRVLFVGTSYYNGKHLSRELRKLGWKADTLTFVGSGEEQYEPDFLLSRGGRTNWLTILKFYLYAIKHYDIFHFSGAHNLTLLDRRNRCWDTKLLKLLGKKIVYSNNGCLDGVSQSSFRKWLPEPVCDSCKWRDVPSVCSDEKNLQWGKLRNEVADYQITLGGNRVDYNDDPKVHEVPEFYCLDPHVWDPELLVPSNYRLSYEPGTIKILHAVGNFYSRSDTRTKENIKSTHIYLPIIERLKQEGYKIELLFFHDVPSKQFRYYQAQADIVIDMLTFGFFGANIREAMMLAKPAVCFLRPEWLENMKTEIPEYVKELPIVNATPQTIYQVLKELIEHPDKRREIGQRGRDFAIKWHSAEAGAKKFDHIYTELLGK